MIPILYRWEGDVMRPIGRFAKEADAAFVIGSNYRLIVEPQHSDASRGHQFAFLDEVWRQLPEALADRYPSQNHFRKALLIDAGYFNELVLDVGTDAGALRVAAQMRADDEYARVVVRGTLVVRRTAKSQKKHEMLPKDFQAAKTKILEIAASLIGVTPDTLTRETGRAA